MPQLQRIPKREKYSILTLSTISHIAQQSNGIIWKGIVRRQLSDSKNDNEVKFLQSLHDKKADDDLNESDYSGTADS